MHTLNSLARADLQPVPSRDALIRRPIVGGCERCVLDCETDEALRSEQLGIFVVAVVQRSELVRPCASLGYLRLRRGRCEVSVDIRRRALEDGDLLDERLQRLCTRSEAGGYGEKAQHSQHALET